MFTLLKKRYMRSKNSFHHRGQTPDTKATKISSSEEISRKQSTTLASEQATICLDINSYAFKAAKPAPLTTMVPKKPFKSKAAIPTRRTPGKHPRRRKQCLSTLVF